VIHGDRDMTVNPVNADQIIAQLEARVEEVADFSAGPLLARDERRMGKRRPHLPTAGLTRKGSLWLERLWLRNWVTPGAVAT